MVISARWYLGFLGLLALERLAELVLSRRNARRAFARGAVESGRAHYGAMAAFHALFIVSCAVEVVVCARAFPGAIGWLALTGAAAAQALRYWAILTLGERWNVRVIVIPGDAPVVKGPYRWVRHPNYAAVALELLCVPIIHGAWMTALLASAGNALLMRARIPAEEAALGASYSRSFAGRPRFIPGGGS